PPAARPRRRAGRRRRPCGSRERIALRSSRALVLRGVLWFWPVAPETLVLGLRVGETGVVTSPHPLQPEALILVRPRRLIHRFAVGQKCSCDGGGWIVTLDPDRYSSPSAAGMARDADPKR